MSEADLQSVPQGNESDQEASLNPAAVMLLEARSRAGFTQKEVADQLFLTTSFIRYIDEGRFEKIPKPAFVKGYLRSYARVVGLSGDEVVAVFEASQISNEADVEIKDVTDEPMGSSTYTGPVFLTGAVGFAGVIIVIILVWLFSGPDEAETEAAVLPAAVSSNDSGGVQVEALQLPSRTVADDDYALDSETFGRGGVSVTDSSLELPQDIQTNVDDAAEAIDEEMTASIASVASVTSTPVSSTPVSSTPVSSTPEEVSRDLNVAVDEIVTSQVTEAGQDIVTVSAGGSDELFFVFSGDCWLEVKDADGQAIYKDLNRSGRSLRIMGAAPFSILLGKAPAASLQFNGKTIDVARYTTADDTAKLRLTR